MLSGMSTLGTGIYVSNDFSALGISSQSSCVEEFGHYYAVGTGFHTEISKELYDEWRTEQHWGLAMFFTSGASASVAGSIMLYLLIVIYNNDGKITHKFNGGAEPVVGKVAGERR
jgi:hypothetical protein